MILYNVAVGSFLFHIFLPSDISILLTFLRASFLLPFTSINSVVVDSCIIIPNSSSKHCLVIIDWSAPVAVITSTLVPLIYTIVLAQSVGWGWEG